MKEQLEALAASWHRRAEELEHAEHDRVIGRAQAFFTVADELRTLIPRLVLAVTADLEDARYGGLRDQCETERKQLERASAAAAEFVPMGKNDVVRAYYAGVREAFARAAASAVVGTQQIAVPVPPDDVRALIADRLAAAPDRAEFKERLADARTAAKESLK